MRTSFCPSLHLLVPIHNINDDNDDDDGDDSDDNHQKGLDCSCSNALCQLMYNLQSVICAF